MKLRDEVKERWGLVVPDEEIISEDDDHFITKSGMGWNRNTETFWRNMGDKDKNSEEALRDEALRDVYNRCKKGVTDV